VAMRCRSASASRSQVNIAEVAGAPPGLVGWLTGSSSFVHHALT
jgi:hypothetical protein